MINPTIEASLPDENQLRDALRSVLDPEAGMNIVDLGLVYGITITTNGVHVLLTMTSPACPLGQMILDDVETALRKALPAGIQVEAELTFTPPWEPSMMSSAAREHFDW